MTESDAIEAETDQIARLEMIARNLKPIPRFLPMGQEIPPAEFTLGYAELEFLGF